MSDRLNVPSPALPNLREIICAMVQRIDLDVHRIRITIGIPNLVRELTCNAMAADDDSTVSQHASRVSRVSRVKRARTIRTTNEADLHVIDLPLSIRQRGVERRLVIDGQATSLRRPDRPLIETLARAHALYRSSDRWAGT